VTEELVVSTPEEYMRLTTRKVRVASGAVFHIQAMGANAMVYLLGISPESGFENQREIIKFVGEHFVELVKRVIEPSVIAPKIDNIAVLDTVDLLVNLMDISGFNVEKDKSFPGG